MEPTKEKPDRPQGKPLIEVLAPYLEDSDCDRLIAYLDGLKQLEVTQTIRAS